MQTGSAQHSKGQILVMTTFVLTVLVGFVGLAADTGYFFDYRRRMVTAADSAALAGAMEVKSNTNSTKVVTVARAAAALNSFTHGTDNITVTVNRPPTSGYHIGNSKFVEVVINRPAPTFFMRILGLTTVTVAARSVAGLGDDQACIYVLDPSADSALQVNGGAVLKAPTCNVYVNSTGSAALYLAGSGACVLANSVNITGNYSGTTCSTSTPYTGTPPVDDPFANLRSGFSLLMHRIRVVRLLQAGGTHGPVGTLKAAVEAIVTHPVTVAVTRLLIEHTGDFGRQFVGV